MAREELRDVLARLTSGCSSGLDDVEVETVHQEDDHLVLDLALQQRKQDYLLEHLVRVVHSLSQPAVVVLLPEAGDGGAVHQLGVDVVQELDQVRPRAQSLVRDHVA